MLRVPAAFGVAACLLVAAAPAVASPPTSEAPTQCLQPQVEKVPLACGLWTIECFDDTTMFPDGPSAWGFGNDCTSSNSNLNSQLLAQARSQCGGGFVRNLSVVITTACYYNPGQGHPADYQTDGFANYECCYRYCEGPIVP